MGKEIFNLNGNFWSLMLGPLPRSSIFIPQSDTPLILHRFYRRAVSTLGFDPPDTSPAVATTIGRHPIIRNIEMAAAHLASSLRFHSTMSLLVSVTRLCAILPTGAISLHSADVPRHDLSATIPPAMILNDIRRNDALPTIFLDDPATTLAPHH